MTIDKDTLEQLSEFVDGQSKRETGIFFAKRLSADSELQSVWSRYHLIRECVRHRGTQAQTIQLQSRVAIALAAEPELNTGQLHNYSAWLKPVAGLAITAVVAVSAIIAVQNNEVGPAQINEIQAADTQSTAFTTPENNGLGPVVANRAVPVSYQAGTSRNNQRLNAYLLRHSQVVATAGRGGVIYLAPIVSAQNTTVSNREQENIGKEQINPEAEDAAKAPDELLENQADK